MNSVYEKKCFSKDFILITGGGSGIGLQTARRVLELGGRVAICGRRPEKLAAAAESLAVDQSSLLTVACDIRKEAEIDHLMDQIQDFGGHLTGLVNNAGGQFPCPLEEMSQRGWEAVVNNNLNGTFRVLKACFDRFFREHGGIVVNILAENRNGMPLMAHTGAARAAVENLTKTAAQEWAKYGVRINAITPGLIETSGLDTYPEEFRRVLEALPQKIPYKRFGRVEEIVEPILFLLSRASNYITGQNLTVGGGLSLSGPMKNLDDYPEVF